MCGVAGIIDCPGAVRDPAWLESLRPVLEHRGPDRFALWQEKSLSLLHWRLAVRDLSAAGNQPMVSHDGRYVICFNGEIYNCQPLREQIESVWQKQANGAEWRGHSDTEVIVEGCSAFGLRFLRELNGIFAIALYDRTESVLTLARDRQGVKPLYVWRNDKSLVFASEAKFLFSALPEYKPEINPEGLAQFVTYGHSTGAAQLLKGLRQVPPGHQMRIWIASGEASWAVATEPFCPPPEKRCASRSPERAAKELRRLFEEVVESQLVSDVPIGVFLSGGVDSSILTALAARILGPSATKAFTLAYAGCGADFDELAAADAVARQLGVQHIVFRATPDTLIGRLEEMVWSYDEPFADAAALNVFALSELVRSHVTVALAGEGSDELFGGYRRYQVERLLRRLGPGINLVRCVASRLAPLQRRLPRRLAILSRSLAMASSAERYSSYFESGVSVQDLVQPEWQCPSDPRGRLKRLYPERLDTEPVAAMCLADQQFWLVDTYLEKSDKGSMAHSLEIRVPFLDNRIVEFANSLPDRCRIHRGQRKWLLRAAFSDLLPDWVFTRFKRGFGVPLAKWFRNELREFFADRVLSAGAFAGQYLRQSVLKRLHEEHCRGKADWSLVLWEALMLELWLSQVSKGFPRPRRATKSG